MEKRDVRAEFLTAFWKLYEKKGIDKMSIRELCQLAGYNRTTFYVYYKNIYDLLDRAVEDIFLQIKEQFPHAKNFSDIFGSPEAVSIILTAFQQKNTYIECLFRHQDYLLLAEKMKAEVLSVLKSQLRDEDDDIGALEYLLEYQISAVFGVIKYWLQTGKTLSEKELVDLIYSISSRGVLPSIRTTLFEDNRQPAEN